jgi:hypothetical protein
MKTPARENFETQNDLQALLLVFNPDASLVTTCVNYAIRLADGKRYEECSACDGQRCLKCPTYIPLGSPFLM